MSRDQLQLSLLTINEISSFKLNTSIEDMKIVELSNSIENIPFLSHNNLTSSRYYMRIFFFFWHIHQMPSVLLIIKESRAEIHAELIKIFTQELLLHGYVIFRNGSEIFRCLKKVPLKNMRIF